MPMVGALRLPVVIDGMIEESTTRRPSTPITRVSRVDHRHRVVGRAHPAGAGGVIGALDLWRDEGVDRLVADDVRAGLDLAAAIRIEGLLREDLAGQAHAGAHLGQSSGWLI